MHINLNDRYEPFKGNVFSSDLLRSGCSESKILKKRLEQFEEKTMSLLSDTFSAISGLTTSNTDHESEIVDLKQKVEDQGSEIVDLKQKMVDLKQKVEDQGEIVDLKQKMVDLKQKIVDLKQKVEDQGSEIVDLKQKMVDLKQKVEDLGSEIVDLKQKVVYLLKKDAARDAAAMTKRFQIAFQDLSKEHNLENQVNPVVLDDLLRNRKVRVEFCHILFRENEGIMKIFKCQHLLHQIRNMSDCVRARLLKFYPPREGGVHLLSEITLFLTQEYDCLPKVEDHQVDPRALQDVTAFWED